MKKVLFSLLIAGNVFASGKLSILGNYYTKENKTMPAAGFNVYENTGLGFFIDGYLGTGIAPRYNWPDVYWWVAKADAVLPFSDDVLFSIGATLKLSNQEWVGVEDESNIHAKLTFKLW